MRVESEECVDVNYYCIESVKRAKLSSDRKISVLEKLENRQFPFGFMSPKFVITCIHTKNCSFIKYQKLQIDSPGQPISPILGSHTKWGCATFC